MRIKNIPLLAAVSLLACACSDIKDDINELKQPLISGVSLLSEHATVKTDGTFPVLFRINPSDYTPAKEDISLLLKSATSDFSLEGQSPSADGKCSIVSVEPYQQDGTMPGAWKAVFKAESANSFNGVVEFGLVINSLRPGSNDKVAVQGEHSLWVSKYVTPSSLTLNVSHAVTQTAQSIGDGTWLSAYSTISAVTPEDGTPAFDLSTIDHVEVKMTGAMADCIEPVVSSQDWTRIEFRPIPAKFNAQWGAQKAYVASIAEIEIMDKIGRTCTLKSRVRFYPNKVIMPATAALTIPKSALNDDLVEIELDYAEALDKIGINPAFVNSPFYLHNGANITIRQEPEVAPGEETVIGISGISPTLINDPSAAKVGFLVNKSPAIAPGSYYCVLHFKVAGLNGNLVDAEIWQEIKYTE